MEEDPKNYYYQSKEIAINLTNLVNFIEKYIEHSSNVEHDRIVLNARGVRYQVQMSEMDRLPDSRLAKLKRCILLSKTNMQLARDIFERERLLVSYNEYFDEFFTDKDPSIVNAILSFYETRDPEKKVHINTKLLCATQLEDEFKYWLINDHQNYLDACCLQDMRISKSNAEEEAANERALLEQLDYKEDFGTSCCPEFRRHVWDIIDHSTSPSIFSKIYMAFSYLIIIVSTVDLVLRTVPSIYQRNQRETINTFSMLEAVVIGWFTFEFLLKLFICPNKIKYLTSVYTICDLISFVPYYIYLANPDVNGLRVLKDISRIFKLCSLMKYFEDWDTLNTIMRTIKQSFKEILVFLVYLIIVLLFFSTLVFYMEYQTEDSKFESIPATLWWAIATMTTVGYGDITPTTVFGKMFGGVLAVCGLIIIAMPVGLLSSNFIDTFKFYKMKARVLKQRRQRSDSMVSQTLSLASNKLKF